MYHWPRMACDFYSNQLNLLSDSIVRPQKKKIITSNIYIDICMYIDPIMSIYVRAYEYVCVYLAKVYIDKNRSNLKTPHL